MDPERHQLESPSAGTDLKHPDSSVTQTGRQDEPLPTAACSLPRVQVLGETLFPAEIAVGMRTDSEITTPYQIPLSCRRAADLKTRRQPAKKISNSTPVGKERSHRLGKRVYRYSFLFLGGTLGLDARACFFCLCLSVCCVLF